MPKSLPKEFDARSPPDAKKFKEDFLRKDPGVMPIVTQSSTQLTAASLSESLCHDDQQLRRPMNAFLLFCKRHRQMVRTRHPWLDNRACTKMLADMWGVLDGEEKEKYLQLARECKAAFMKAHPDYRWSGSNKNCGKVTNPGSINTRPHLTGKSDCGATEGDAEGDSKSGIALGKLADPSQMGGLSLLLLAGQEAISKTPQATDCHTSSDAESSSQDQLRTVRRSNSEPAVTSGGSHSAGDQANIKSPLFQFAEMCSDQLAIKSSDVAEDWVVNKHLNNNSIMLDRMKHVKHSSTKPGKTGKKVIKKLHNATTGTAVNSELCKEGKTGRKSKSDCEAESNQDSNNGTEMVKEVADVKSDCKKRNENRIKSGMSGKVVIARGEMCEKREKPKKEGILSASWPLTLKQECQKEEGVDDDDRRDREDGADEKKEAGEDTAAKDGDGDTPNVRRKSRRSCKGRLYRKLVDQGMLESLQRPERPFNCKKAWRHTQEGMSGFSDAEDEVFEPDEDRPRKGGNRRSRSRKRTSSGSSVNAADFDYGEIDVEARLATLPQYSPEQFRPKGKTILKSKKRSDIYRNSKFVREDEKVSRSRPIRSVSVSEAVSSLVGSQKRKARKSSIMHLLPTKGEDSASPFQPNRAGPSSQSEDKKDAAVMAKVKRSLSDPQPFTLSDLAEVASMELKPCSSTIPKKGSKKRVDAPSLRLSVVTVS